MCTAYIRTIETTKVDTVMIALPVVGEVVVTQDDAGAVLLGVQRDDDARGAGRDCGVVGPAPGEHHPARGVDLDELAGRLDAVLHVDAVRAAGHRLQHGVAPHPLDVAARVGEVGKHRLRAGRDVHADFDHVVIGHDDPYHAARLQPGP